MAATSADETTWAAYCRSGGRRSAQLMAAISVNGVPRILDLMDKHRVRMSSFMIGDAVRRHPKVAAEIANRGHEAGAHARTSKRQYRLDREREKARIGSTYHLTLRRRMMVIGPPRAPFGTSVAGACARKDEIATWTPSHPETACGSNAIRPRTAGCPAATDTTNERRRAGHADGVRLG